MESASIHAPFNPPDDSCASNDGMIEKRFPVVIAPIAFKDPAIGD